MLPLAKLDILVDSRTGDGIIRPIVEERWPSGRRRSPAKGVWGLNPIEGSNPSFSAMFFAPVAQLDRVSGYEPEGREFESLRARHNSIIKLSG